MTGRAVLLYYDEFHTPLRLLAPPLADYDGVTVLVADLGDGDAAEDVPSGWPVVPVDLRADWAERFLLPAIKANAVYQGGYHLHAALSRPLLAEAAVTMCRKLGAQTLVHGLAGNDQLRLEMSVAALAPETAIVSVPSLIGSQNTRSDDGYTVSSNLWGRSIEAGGLAVPDVPAPPDAYAHTAPEAVGHRAERHDIGFERGRPMTLDDRALDLGQLIAALADIGAHHGVGAVDMVEDGFVGLKTRALYEAPAAAAVVAAHRDLERFVSSRHQNRFKELVDKAWAELVYDGHWHDPQRDSLDAYIDHVNQWVTGEVTLGFLPGSVHVVGRRSPHALYTADEAVYRAGQDFGSQSSYDMAFSLSAHMRAASRRKQPPDDKGA